MNSDMLLLAERLVLAVETISEDVKNMSAYIYDLNFSVSHFLNNKNGNVGISVVTGSESGNPPCDPPANEEEDFTESKYSLPCEQVNGSSVPYMEHEMSVRGVGCISNDRAESSNVLASITGHIKVEEPSESNENGIDSSPDSGRYIVRDHVADIKDEIDIHEDFFPLPEETDVLVTMRSPEVEDSTIHITRCPENHGSIPETQKGISACALEGHSVHYHPEDTDRVDGKLLRGHMNDSEEPHQESCRAAGASSSSSEQKLIHDGKEKEEQRESYMGAGERPYRAQKKKKASAKKSLSEQRRRQKRSRGPFRCDTCGKCFNSKFHLETHKRIHTSERPFHCALCNKTCSSKSNLKVHMSVHSEERPYKCSTCDKSFKEKSHLKSHVQVHSGEKPFICRECGKAFTHSCTLKCHMRQHSGEKPFICTECGKSFTDNSNLFTHMRTHTGEHPFTCEDCGSSFTQSNNLKRHRCTVHGVASPVS